LTAMQNKKSMKCDLHIHSNLSDGLNPVEDVLRDGQAMDLEIMAITDHYHHLAQGKGKLDAYVDKIAKLRDNYSPRILIGVEVQMDNQNGEIKLNTNERGKLDIVLVELMGTLVFGLKDDPLWKREKSSKKQLIETVFASYINICQNPLIDVIAHPFNLGRLNADYSFSLADIPYSLLCELAQNMAKHKKAFEIQSQFYYWYPKIKIEKITSDYIKIIRLFASNGVKFSVGSDAHSCGTIGNLYWAKKVINGAGLSQNWHDWFIDINERTDQ